MPQNSVDDHIEKILAIRKLNLEFQMIAKEGSRIIISEVALPNDKKTIKSIDAGGVAGGEKFIYQGKNFILKMLK